MPSRSTDLNPLDYFLWGYLKKFDYSKLYRNVEELTKVSRMLLDIQAEEDNNANCEGSLVMRTKWWLTFPKFPIIYQLVVRIFIFIRVYLHHNCLFSFVTFCFYVISMFTEFYPVFKYLFIYLFVYKFNILNIVSL